MHCQCPCKQGCVGLRSKSSNILLTEQDTAKLADVGLARTLQLATHDSLTTMRGQSALSATCRCTCHVSAAHWVDQLSILAAADVTAWYSYGFVAS